MKKQGKLPPFPFLNVWGNVTYAFVQLRCLYDAKVDGARRLPAGDAIAENLFVRCIKKKNYFKKKRHSKRDYEEGRERERDREIERERMGEIGGGRMGEIESKRKKDVYERRGGEIIFETQIKCKEIQTNKR